jgi:pimeloyl-ACP methyl ester carboxylesterase
VFRFSGLLHAAVVARALSLTAARAGAADDAASHFAPAPKPVESFDVGTLHVDKFGAGEQSLVLIPGLGCGPWVWHGTITKFAPTHTVYVLTLPGFSGHPAAKEAALFATVQRDFWEMLATRKIVKPLVVGHSLGGMLAIAVAAEHPDHLSAIVAVDGLPIYPTLARLSEKARKGVADDIAKHMTGASEAETLANHKAYMSSVGTNRPELVEPAATLLARSDPRAVAAWMRELIVTDLRPKLPRATIPMLEIMPYQPPAAGQEPGYTQEQTLGFYKSLVMGAPKASVVAITPSRHFVMLDQPEALYDALAKFFASVPR